MGHVPRPCLVRKTAFSALTQAATPYPDFKAKVNFVKKNVLLSAIAGLLFGIIGYPVLWYFAVPYAFVYAVVGALFMYLMLLGFLVFYEKHMNKRYAAFEKTLTSPVFFKTNGNFHLADSKLKNGNIYFCEKGIVCVCLEEKPYTLDEILHKDIGHIVCTPTRLNIFAKDGRIFIIDLPKTEEIVRLLTEKGWISLS